MLRVPTIRAVIRRRLLVNFRVEPTVAAALLPSPFEPQRVTRGGRSWAMAGICLIRLEQVRPRWMPAIVGLSSENAAHRFAVTWPTPDGNATGVYLPRRDTDSRLNVAAGGRIFPGVHHAARFDVDDDGSRVRFRMASEDGAVRVEVDAEAADALPSDSVFATPADASAFFEAGSVGYSPKGREVGGCLDGLELRCEAWKASPLAVSQVFSSYFTDESLFPPGSVAFDHALVMRDIPHEWHNAGDLESREPATV